MTPLRPNWPAGLPSPYALQIATDAVCRLYILPETERHPVVEDQALELAYLLAAYGLGQTEQQKTAAAQTDAARNSLVDGDLQPSWQFSARRLTYSVRV
jgi:hypothetical protein